MVNSPILPAGAQLSTTLVDQGSQAGDLLGIALLINRNPEIQPADDPQRDTVLAALRDTGFLTYDGDHIGAANTAVVVTGGALGDDARQPGLDGRAVRRGLAPHGSGTVLAGRDGSATGTAAVAVTRADAGMAGDVTTVDDIGVESGRITTVLALQNLISGGPHRPVRHRPRRDVDHRPAVGQGQLRRNAAHGRVSDGLSASVLG